MPCTPCEATCVMYAPSLWGQNVRAYVTATLRRGGCIASTNAPGSSPPLRPLRAPNHGAGETLTTAHGSCVWPVQKGRGPFRSTRRDGGIRIDREKFSETIRPGIYPQSPTSSKNTCRITGLPPFFAAGIGEPPGTGSVNQDVREGAAAGAGSHRTPMLTGFQGFHHLEASLRGRWYEFAIAKTEVLEAHQPPSDAS
jgi:hypothetical protein